MFLPQRHFIFYPYISSVCLCIVCYIVTQIVRAIATTATTTKSKQANEMNRLTVTIKFYLEAML